MLNEVACDLNISNRILAPFQNLRTSLNQLNPPKKVTSKVGMSYKKVRSEYFVLLVQKNLRTSRSETAGSRSSRLFRNKRFLPSSFNFLLLT